jgi:ferredoxin
MVYALVSGANRDPRAYERASSSSIASATTTWASPTARTAPRRTPRAAGAAARGRGMAAGDPRLPRRHRRGAGRARRRRDDDADQPAAGVGGGIVKLTVDGASCMGHGRCYLMAPDLLAYDDEGYVTIRDQTIDVPDDQVKPPRMRKAPAPSRRSPFSRERTRRRRRRSRSVRLLRSRPAAQAGHRGRPVRRAADTLRARARRRRARPPEDQVGDADVRQDRPASGLPLLRRRRARRRGDRRRAAGATRSARRPTTGWGSRATSARARSPPHGSSPGTTATRGTPMRRSTCPAPAPS